jgi:hypothetical protein
MPPLQPFTDNLYLADGPVVHAMGLPFPTRMIVVRLSDGSLWINSPVAVSETVLQQIQEWGPVEHLVAPTKLHVWRLKAWHTRFPGAKLWAPPQIPHSLERLPFVGVLGDGAPAAWSSDLDQLVFRGNLFIEEVQFLHKASGTLIFGDAIPQHPI